MAEACGGWSKTIAIASGNNRQQKSGISDTMYIEELNGPDTVITAPLSTIEAFRDNGVAAATLEADADQALYRLETLTLIGIDMEDLPKQ